MSLFHLCALFLGILAAPPPAPPPPAPPADAVRPAIERGIHFIAGEGLKWKAERKCAACHHVGLTIWAMNEARAIGIKPNEEALQELFHWVETEKDAGKILPKPGGQRDTRGLNLGPAYLTLAFESADPAPEVDASIQRFARFIAQEQVADGSWGSNDVRPPVTEKPEFSTLLARMALTSPLLRDDDWRTTYSASLAKADAWLATPPPPSPTETQSRNMRLLLALREGKSPATSLDLVAPLHETISKQNADGGWSQNDGAPSDALATGQTLYVLGRAGYTQSDPLVSRAAKFLTDAQKEDGSWPMLSRPTQPDGTGSAKNLAPITNAGSAWAILGLVRTLPR